MKNGNSVWLLILGAVLLAGPAFAQSTKTMRAEAVDPWLGSLSWKMRTSTSLLYSEVPANTNNFKWKFCESKLQPYGRLESLAFPNFFLKPNGRSAGAGVIVVSCDPNDTLQNWYVDRQRIHDSRGWYSFRNFSTGLCLQGTKLPAPMLQQNCSTGSNQAWSVYNETQGQFETTTPW